MKSVADTRFKEVIKNKLTQTGIATSLEGQWMIEPKWIPYYNKMAREHDMPPPRMLMLMYDPRYDCPIKDTCQI